MFLIKNNIWKIKKTKDKGFGVFTKKEIKQGTIIGDYLGQVIKTAEYDFSRDKKELFLMYLTDKASIYPDLAKPGIHLLNHSCEPNCWICIYKGHTLFFALGEIKPGEELTISYLLAPNEDCKPCTHICKCGSKNCSGTMHLSKEKYEKWQEQQAREKKKAGIVRFAFNKNLPRLNSYPKKIDSENYAAFSSSTASAATSSSEVVTSSATTSSVAASSAGASSSA